MKPPCRRFLKNDIVACVETWDWISDRIMIS